ncbi:MAG: DUF2066 domain-containing protein [gamma proteobacterium symbiont of Taylorina sp.]|nr:DUF2066 domain-containing protein [gamma proteobacterium symbiont of Taylorina sp.]
MKHKYHYLIHIILLCLFLVQLSHAVGLDKRYEAALYESSVKVETGKSENELINKAFTQVLIKVSGRSDVTQSAAYSSILKQSKNAISQFRYDYKTLTESADSEQKNIEGDKEDEKEKWFWIQFDAKTVENLLKDAQLPVWGNTRPVTLIWLSQEINGKRIIQSQHDDIAAYDALEEKSEQRGISLIFPFFDLQDQNNISANDIWGDFSDTILIASRRYQAQATLTIRLFQEKSGLWHSRWNLLLLGESHVWTIRNKNRSDVLSAGIDKLADNLAQQFTPRYNSDDDQTFAVDEGILIQVNNVSDYNEFQKLDNYFNSLATVKSVTLLQVQQDRLIYKVSYLGSKRTLVQEIKLSDMLNSIDHSSIDNRFNEDKDYQSVILDDLDKKSAQEHEGQALEQSEQKQETGLTESTLSSVKPEKLVPELEYWLVR